MDVLAHRISSDKITFTEEKQEKMTDLEKIRHLEARLTKDLWEKDQREYRAVGAQLKRVSNQYFK